MQNLPKIPFTERRLKSVGDAPKDENTSPIVAEIPESTIDNPSQN